LFSHLLFRLLALRSRVPGGNRFYYIILLHILYTYTTIHIHHTY
jgi:hypothetical protein